MIITTGGTVEGYEITEYKGIQFGEVISGVNMFKDIGAGFRDIFGGRSQGYENELTHAREEALRELQERSAALGANAVIGVKMDYETVGQGGSMLMVTASGTAVVIKKVG
ncbi:MAG: heavy metal-binding domain-containing protein [Culicoidibacterales bacterium]